MRCWKAQTHVERELVVVDDGEAGPGARSCDGTPGGRSLHVPEPTLGAKPNLGAEAARGEILAKWDDDDWYGPRYLETALAALAACPAGEGFVLWDCYLVYLAWNGHLKFTGHGHKAGSSLCFERLLWETAPFRDLPHSVDSWFIADHGGRFRPVCGEADQLVAVRHGANTWRRFWDVDVDRYVEEELADWPLPITAVVDPEAAAFYAGLPGRSAAVDRPP